jgi:hypothetical protein
MVMPSSHSGVHGERVIRVFASSTFRDMQSERDELIKHIFPQLRRLCEQRGVTWGEVDLRWGVTEEETRQGKAIRICLDEVDHCRPYFIGLLGERYGWVPQPHDLEKDAELWERHAWIHEVLQKGCSATEVEIEHAAFRDPSRMEHAFFYFRDPQYVHQVPAERVTDFLDGEPSAREKLALLKQRLRDSRFRLRENYPDPVTVGRMILDDFTALIQRLFPEEEIPSPLEREAAAHRVFATSHCRMYLGRQDYFDRLDDHAVADSGPPLVVYGAPGLGKSTLLASWFYDRQGAPLGLTRLARSLWSRVLRPLRRAVQPFQTGDCLLCHFIGASPQSTDWAAPLRRLLAELKGRCGLPLDIPDSPAQLRTAFVQGLALAAAKGRIILLLDGLDQLEDRDQALDLYWLPERLPDRVRLIVSTASEHQRAVLRSRGWQALEVKPLRPFERALGIRRRPSGTGRSPRHFKRLSLRISAVRRYLGWAEGGIMTHQLGIVFFNVTGDRSCPPRPRPGTTSSSRTPHPIKPGCIPCRRSCTSKVCMPSSINASFSLATTLSSP